MRIDVDDQAALYFHALPPQDKVAVKPHPGRCSTRFNRHGLLDLDRLQRGLSGMQGYPWRNKDKISADFSASSVGPGVAVTAFASLLQG